MTYNTQLKKLVLPEYGRNIQRMVDHCMDIHDRDLRTDCAHSIVDAMYQMFPPTGDPNEYRRKLWDHLAIMSDFELDIDWPFEPLRPDDILSKPDPMPLPVQERYNRQYGKNVEFMVAEIAHMPECPDREILIMLIANHMKKILTTTENDSIEDAKVLKDLRYMSHGMINVDPQTMHLHEFKPLAPPKKKKKK